MLRFLCRSSQPQKNYLLTKKFGKNEKEYYYRSNRRYGNEHSS